MSRNIPQVRDWRITYYFHATKIASVIVAAPNKQFARWAARDALGWKAWSDATKISVSLVKGDNAKYVRTDSHEDTCGDCGVGAGEHADDCPRL